MSDQTVSNPLLDRIRIPGETFTLPSGGLFYKNGELDESVKNGEVTINPMTAYDEIIIKTPDKLFSGKAIEEIFQRCIPQINKPLDLLAKDVDFLLICLRKVTFGEIIEVTYQHDCEGGLEHTYNLNVTSFIKDAKRIDPTTVSNKYSVTMENGQKITLSPTKFRDYIDLMQSFNNDDQTPEEIRDVTIKSLLNSIVSVDETSEPEHITEWLGAIPSSWIRKIADKIEETADWGPSYTDVSTCKDCEKQIEITAPLNPVAFFT